MREVRPIRVGILIDYIEAGDSYQGDLMRTFELVAEEFRKDGAIDRDVEFIVEAVQGLPEGDFKSVRDAFYRLVDRGCLAIFGPWVSENAMPLSEDVHRLA